MPTDPKALLAGPLRRAGIPDVDTIVLEQLALLRGHQLLADDGTPRRQAKPKADRKLCGGDCLAVELIGNVCPICQWSPTP